MNITKEFWFQAAHRLETHDGPCSKLHGHGYRVVIELEGDIEIRENHYSLGMVKDYGRISHAMKSIIDENLDHRFLVAAGQGAPSLRLANLMKAIGEEEYSVLPIKATTAEEIARWILRMAQQEMGRLVVACTVHETNTTSARIDGWQVKASQ